MLKRLLLLVTAVTLALFLQGRAMADVQKQALDGKTFHGTVGMKGDTKGDPDDFEFAAGTFHSTSCDQYGYTESPYTATAGAEQTDFTSVTKNKAGDTISWNGKIKGDKIEGTALRKTASGKEFEMWFNGELKAEKANS